VFHDAANLSISRFLRLVSGSRPNTRSNTVEEFDSNTRCSQTPTKITILFSRELISMYYLTKANWVLSPP
jgi:hypothetical protein